MLKEDGPTKLLQDIFAENELHPLITSPTRITKGSGTIIDLFITNEPTRYIHRTNILIVLTAMWLP